MTFLNPLALLGLIAAAIPVLLHLFNLRKLRTIEFSTLAFLKELQKTRIRRLKIRQLILLILRTLIVILVALAFSRPALKGTIAAGVGTQAKTTMVILFDDSYSMTVSGAQGEAFRRARENVRAVFNLLKEGDEASLIRFSEIDAAAGDAFAPRRDLGALRSALDGIQPSTVRRPMESALRIAAKVLSASKNFNKEVYVVSDFQEGLFMEQASAAKAENLFDAGVRFFFIPLGEKELHNCSIQSAAIPSTVFEPGRPFTVKAAVKNHSKDRIRNTVVSVFLNGSRVAQRAVDIDAGAVTDVTFEVVPKGAGIQNGMVELEEDALGFDNRRWFSVVIPPEVRVLLVGAPADLEYARLALATRQNGDSSGFVITETTPARLSSGLFALADVVVFVNVRELNPVQSERLAAFLNGGGGMLFFPGDLSEPAAYAVSFGTPLKLPAMTGIERLNAQPGVAAGYLEFDRTDMRHPLFEGMFERDAKNAPGPKSAAGTGRIESPRVSAFARFVPTAASVQVITLGNGAPFLLEQRIGSGTALLMASAPLPEWSTLPYKALFVPLMVRSVSYLAQQQSMAGEHLAGETMVWKVGRSNEGTFRVKDPQGNETIVMPVMAGETRTLTCTRTETPGLYTIRAGAAPVYAFAVNTDARESETAPVSSDRLKALEERIGIASSAVHEIGSVADVERTVLQSRYGLELWKYALIAALVLALAETLVARETRRSAMGENGVNG